MFCYNCGCHLSEHDFCTACGADVSLYKKIMYVSNRFYNDGLEKAAVRDLSGAVNSLRQSLKFNKNNIDARNLLGLVYFEMGEVVAALSEWVISKNMRSDKNIADDYINMIQSNPTRLDSINQTIKKYNQALVYCLQDSKDLAVIQLKKVLSLNPKFIRAHQLLALLYMDAEDWDHAQRELKKCENIDRNNTLTLRYSKEVEQMLAPEDGTKQTPKHKKDDVVRYQRDNEVIIQPLNVKEQKNSGASTLINIGIGLVIGLAAMYFLVVPSIISNANNESQKTIKDIGNQLDVKTSRIQELESELDSIKADNDSLQKELEAFVGTDGTIKTMDSLLEAAQNYLDTEDAVSTAEYLETIAEGVNLEETSDSFKGLYNILVQKIGPTVSATYYSTGYSAYKDEDYQTAIVNLKKAVFYDAKNGDALYNLGNAYRMSENAQEAIPIYQKVVENFPGTEKARKSQQYLDQYVQQNAAN
ncbi:MAG: tetratricopeptide repeat protein [Acetatifactor sp.]|nr:tetratricopeptide repeat protein [Acetatifactor sp.]